MGISFDLDVPAFPRKNIKNQKIARAHLEISVGT
jgi:hypothetical protein